MKVAEFQAYTSSPINKWRADYDRYIKSGVQIPDIQIRYDSIPGLGDWVKSSSRFGFENWIQITDKDFVRAGRWLNENGRILSIGNAAPMTVKPFRFIASSKNSISCRQGHCYTYLNEGVLIAAMARPHIETSVEPEYIIDPSSPHFREADLVEHIDIALFAETRKAIDGIAKKLELPSKALVKA